MGRISERDAVRLGILPAPGGSRATVKGGPGPRKAKADPATGAGSREPASRAKPNRRPILVGEPFAVQFFVPGEPSTKARARTMLPKQAVHAAFVMAGGDEGAFARSMAKVKHRSFTPAATARYEALVSRVAAAAMRSRCPCDGPVEMLVAFLFEGDEATWPTDHSDPDIDNVQKAVMDALKGVVWTDDRLVVRISQVKACARVPGVLVRVRSATPFGRGDHPWEAQVASPAP